MKKTGKIVLKSYRFLSVILSFGGMHVVGKGSRKNKKLEIFKLDSSK